MGSLLVLTPRRAVGWKSASKAVPALTYHHGTWAMRFPFHQPHQGRTRGDGGSVQILRGDPLLGCIHLMFKGFPLHHEWYLPVFLKLSTADIIYILLPPPPSCLDHL